MTAAIAATERPRLKREIGLWMATALVIGNPIGSTIFLLPRSTDTLKDGGAPRPSDRGTDA